MKTKTLRILALLLATVMMTVVIAGCKKDDGDALPEPSVPRTQHGTFKAALHCM